VLSSKKPEKLSGIVGNPSAAAAIKGWASEWASGKTPPPLLICGPTGIGKTAFAYAAAAEQGWEIFEFNASDFRNEENVEKLLSNAAMSGTIWGCMRLILIDDADSLSGSGDRGGASAIARVLSSAKQPIILTARDLYDKKLQPFRALCTPVPLQRVTASTIATLLKRTASEHSIAISEESIGKIAKAASGDVRAALNDLQGANTGASRDSERGVFETVSAILKATDYSTARKAAASSEANHDLLKLWIAHNLPAEYEKPFDLAEGYSALSRADVFDGRISRTQYWGYLRYSSDLLSAGVAVAKEAPYHKFTRFGFPDYLREMGASKSSRALRKGALRKIAAICHCSLSQAAMYLPLLELLAGKNQEETSAIFSFDEDETAFVCKRAPKKEKVAREKGRPISRGQEKKANPDKAGAAIKSG
jgi:replication factor C large subunit